jgi:two-component system, chemotaxis family, chemotaxis protein CheV
MSDVMREVDERSKLAGTNKFELLIFRLGEDRIRTRARCLA